LVSQPYNEDMATLELNLPDRLKSAAESRAVEAGYRSIDDYIASLIEADEVAPISDSMEAELLRGLSSGPSEEINSEFISKLRERARRRR
jgi:hypothetical protein